ncbi:MAG: hypothetical protein JST22_16030 [Bacteroidetes bacterium]|nr:hypothetical protein [Bacteroidota bacterium]
MKILTGLLAVAALCLFATAARATTTVEHIHSDVGGHCTDRIVITVDKCQKILTRDCDDANPCGWFDNGWDCGGHGNIMPSGGNAIPATFDGDGNLVCSVAPGTGGVYSSGSSGNGVCFAPDYSATLMVSASIMGGLN